MNLITYKPGNYLISSMFTFLWGIVQKPFASNTDVAPSPYVYWIRPTLGRIILAACIKCFIVDPIFQRVVGNFAEKTYMLIEIICISFVATIPIPAIDTIFCISFEVAFNFAICAILPILLIQLKKLLETFTDIANRFNLNIRTQPVVENPPSTTNLMNNSGPSRSMSRISDDMYLQKTRSGTIFGHYYLGRKNTRNGRHLEISNNKNSSSLNVNQPASLSGIKCVAFENPQNPKSNTSRQSLITVERLVHSQCGQELPNRITRKTRSGKSYGFYPVDREMLIH